jgi:RHS repeat-associated protein
MNDSQIRHGALSMVYDGDGNRVSETAAGVTTKYLVDTLNPTGYSQVLDELVNGSVTKTYTYGLQRISENQLVGSTWTPSFYGYDGHGNVRFLANSAGTVTDTYTFDAFGAPIASTGTTANNFLYSGEWLDPNLSFYNLRARYYNMLTGRFETMDPYAGRIMDPATLHKYTYTRNNPTNRVDPSGRVDIIEVAFLFSRPGFSVLGRASLTFDPTKVEDSLIDLGLQGSDVLNLTLNVTSARGIGVCDAATLLVASAVLGGFSSGGAVVSNVLQDCFADALAGFADNAIYNPLH